MRVYEIERGERFIEELEPGDKFMLLELAKDDTWRYDDESYINALKKQVLVVLSNSYQLDTDPSCYYQRQSKRGGTVSDEAYMSHGAKVRRV